MSSVEDPLSTGPRSPGLLALDVTVATARPVFRAGLAVGRRLPAATRPLSRAMRSRPVVVLARRGRPYRISLLQELDTRFASVLTGVVEQVLRRVDLSTLIARNVDLAGLAETVIASVDLPEIIRESTSTVSSEAVREVRMRGIAADDVVSRAVERFGIHRQRTHAPLTTPEGGART